VIRAAAPSILLAAIASAACAKPIAPGVYGNVRYSPESGDLGGIELQLAGTGEAARVEFVLCEGWCGPSHTAPITLKENGFAFDYAEQYVDEHGPPAPSQGMHVYVSPAGTGLDVTVTPVDSPGAVVRMRLKPLKGRYGLAVADRD
jgi:hypothetical protein